MHCNLRPPDALPRRSFWAVLANFVLRMAAASDQTSDITIRFSDPDFLK